ncbi:hypothetical protein D9758_014306 [Tetrapyrgos nigripes]|uniref:HAT C-terminal dimerisation domain-containing protein n=1 Tax=Tetrapyrgos nigripes TaxID=182062 RepID=A0A8H5FIF6_9AGAR|nr:hypothetical protein D9758_014306 [Tetrapyrgos nigripes]
MANTLGTVQQDANPGRRPRVATSKVTDPNNIGEIQLSSHQQARAHAKASENTASNAVAGEHVTTKNTESTHASKRKPTGDANGNQQHKKKRRSKKTGNESAAEDTAKNTAPELMVDLAMSSSESEVDDKAKLSVTRDIDHFFRIVSLPGGKKKKECVLCRKRYVVNTSTCRRHMQSDHGGKYRKWARENNFISMLPEDSQARCQEKQDPAQSSIEGHVRPLPPRENVVPYSDALFLEAAIEWLAETNQPINAIHHPKFQNMIDIAAQATNGVKIPGRKATRRAIIDLFKKNISALRQRLLSDAVQGTISITCDAWQAGNGDAYFAVTGHWIEEKAPGEWKLEGALLGFTQMNSAHSGLALGRALFKILRCFKIVNKLGWVTCDNASNNGTMLETLGRLVNAHSSRRGMKKWDHVNRHIQCLAHIINLATQALISTHSKAKHYDPESPESHEPDLEAVERDVLGLVRAIVVKVRSSAKRKQAFLDLQLRTTNKALQLLIDMVFVDVFLYELSREEKDVTKRRKIDGLALSNDEWIQVNTLIDLLTHADSAQQAFSSEHEPTLHNAIPALERLHIAWEKRKSKTKYTKFTDALNAGVDKLGNYYNKTSDSDAYVFSMLLNPNEKMGYFKANWDEDECKEVLAFTEQIFKERYEELNGKSALSQRRSLAKSDSTLLRELSDDEDDESTTQGSVRNSATTPEPWRSEFNLYLSAIDVVPTGMSIVKWWGSRTSTYPTWSSLARDYLAIMGSSVSSERAFSGGGIVISKRRNRLKSDVVEALQFLKCVIKRNLIFREHASSKTEYASEGQDVAEELEFIEEHQEFLKDSTYDEIWQPDDSQDDEEWEDVVY